MSNLFVMKPVADKGLGLIAGVDIEPGQLIISEPPILRLLAVDGQLTPKAAIDLERQFSRLPDNRRVIINSLANNYAWEDTHIMGVFKTNAMIISNRESGLFPSICRANHSCVPCCTYVWDEQSQLQSMFACRKISCGEELTVSYLPDNMVETRDNRQVFLKEFYSFECACEICSLREGFVLRQDEEDRAKAKWLIGVVNKVAGGLELRLGLDNTKQMYIDACSQLHDHIKCMVIHPTLEYLVINCLFSVSVLCLSMEKALFYADKAASLSVTLTGENSTDTQDWTQTKLTLRDQFLDLATLQTIVEDWKFTL